MGWVRLTIIVSIFTITKIRIVISIITAHRQCWLQLLRRGRRYMEVLFMPVVKQLPVLFKPKVLWDCE